MHRLQTRISYSDYRKSQGHVRKHRCSLSNMDDTDRKILIDALNRQQNKNFHNKILSIHPKVCL